MGSPNPRFAGARTLLARGRTHMAELGRMQNSSPPWGVQVRPDVLAGAYVYSLYLDRDALQKLEPIVADAANNLVHALDQIVAAWVRLNGTDRPRNAFYPTALGDDRFEAGMAKIGRHLPVEALSAIRGTREERWHQVEHVALVKELSNSAKHWNLVPTEFAPLAVGVAQTGAQDVTDIPAEHFRDHDRFEFLRTRVPPGPMIGYQVLVSLRFVGLQSALLCDPATALRCAAEFVEAAIENSERACLSS